MYLASSNDRSTCLCEHRVFQHRREGLGGQQHASNNSIELMEKIATVKDKSNLLFFGKKNGGKSPIARTRYDYLNNSVRQPFVPAINKGAGERTIGIQSSTSSTLAPPTETVQINGVVVLASSWRVQQNAVFQLPPAMDLDLFHIDGVQTVKIMGKGIFLI